MKTLFLTSYRYREGLTQEDLRAMTKAFSEAGVSPGVIAQYERLDGKGGFIVEEFRPEDVDRSYELTLRYGRWLEFDAVPVTPVEEAFPVIQRVHG